MDTPRITYCIPSKNNLRYLKWCIPSIRKNASRPDHAIHIFVDRDTDGTVEWLESVKDTYGLRYWVNPNKDTLYGIGMAYDTLIEAAETDIVCVFHADMYLCKDADVHAVAELSKNTVVCSTRIEPPLHPDGREKIVRDFGMWPEVDIQDGFRENDLSAYVDTLLASNLPNTNGMFAPWYIHKEDILSIGGHDPIMRSAREDSDLFNRFLLAGYELKQSWKSFVYHLTCRGGQFEHGVLTKDHSQKSKDWQELMEQSTREFIRKWGTYVRTDAYLHPYVPHRYRTRFHLTSPCDVSALRAIEPFADYITFEGGVHPPSVAEYIKIEQPKTVVNLAVKFTDIQDNDSRYGVVVSFDPTSPAVMQSFGQVIPHLPDILTEHQDGLGTFDLNPYTIQILDLSTHEHRLRDVHERSPQIRDCHV